MRIYILSNLIRNLRISYNDAFCMLSRLLHDCSPSGMFAVNNFLLFSRYQVDINQLCVIFERATLCCS